MQIKSITLLSFLWILLIMISKKDIKCKTTLSKIQYVNAIRDIIEGLIKSLATRQKIEQNNRMDLHEYRKMHQRRLGENILICKLCKEIFVDPDKYFDHAHSHVVEKMQLLLTTSSPIQCKLCDQGYNNKFDYYKHCYEEHLAHNIELLKTTPTIGYFKNYAKRRKKRHDHTLERNAKENSQENETKLKTTNEILPKGTFPNKNFNIGLCEKSEPIIGNISNGDTAYTRRQTHEGFYPHTTASKIIEKIGSEKLYRYVRITKDLRTTKKVTAKLVEGNEEFTGDAFYGESGEFRYSRLMGKLISTQVYMKCPWCPLRFYFQSQLMAHIDTHNLSHLGLNPSPEAPFSTFAPHETKINFDDVDLENFGNGFPAFDGFEDSALSTLPSTPPTTSPTTMSLDEASKLLHKVLDPNFMKGLFTSPRPTRNIDFLHRDRTTGATLPNMLNLAKMLEGLRDDLRKVGSTLIEAEMNETRAENLTTQAFDHGSVRIEEITEHNLDIKTNETQHKSVRIEELTEHTMNITNDIKRYGTAKSTKSFRDDCQYQVEVTTHFSKFDKEELEKTDSSTEDIRGYRDAGNDKVNETQCKDIEAQTIGVHCQHRQEEMSFATPKTNASSGLGPTIMSYETSYEHTTAANDNSLSNTTKMSSQEIDALFQFLEMKAANTSSTSSYDAFLKSLANIKEDEQKRREQKMKDYDEKIKKMEEKIDHANTPLFINEKDMRFYKHENKEQSDRVANAFKMIMQNDVREQLWNSTTPDTGAEPAGATPNVDEFDFGSQDYATITEYNYDPENMKVFENELPTKSTAFPGQFWYYDRFTTTGKYYKYAFYSTTITTSRPEGL